MSQCSSATGVACASRGDPRSMASSRPWRRIGKRWRGILVRLDSSANTHSARLADDPQLLPQSQQLCVRSYHMRSGQHVALA
jgi:hypothetical protein